MCKRWTLLVISLLALLSYAAKNVKSSPVNVLPIRDLPPSDAPIDDPERTNLDNRTYTGTDAKYPIPLKDGQTMHQIKLDTTHPGLGLTRKIRQVSQPTPPFMDYLLFGNRQFLVQMNRDRSRIEAFRFSSINNVIAADFDIRCGYYFWSDVATRQILRSNLDGTNLTVLIQTGITVPDGIAWDWVNKLLYWTDMAEGDIEVYDPETGYRRVLLRTGGPDESRLRAIVLDPASRWMYWTDWGTRPRIERASMDGTSRTTLHSTNLEWPNGLTLDFASQTLYWADAGDSLNRIEASNADGTNRRIITTQSVHHPFGIDVFGGALYWSDWQVNAILYCPLSAPNNVGVIFPNLIYDPMGLRVVSLSKQPSVTNPCASGSKQCSHLCLLSCSASRGYTCACPDGGYLSTDQASCIFSPSSTSTLPPTDLAQCTPVCQNAGICILPGVCDCAAGWTGNRCQQPTCTPPCLNGGTCTAPGICACPSGWEGNTCEQAICASGFCQNGGSCARPGLCSCPDGWVGTRCDQPVCTRVCEHGSCTGPDTCTCRTGWTGELCSEAVCNPPCENGDCVRPDECVCHSGWEGRLCDDPICEPGCLNGGDCVSPNTCECFPPYSGSTCADVECFPPSGCLNGGHCVSSSQCACPTGWSGIRCEIPLCGSIRCVHGHCENPNSCSCNSGWKGTTCEEAICFPPTGCQNGGHCVIPGICSCASGWTGERCDEGVCTRGCHHGNCIQPEQCACNEGWSGSTCNDAICLPPCENGGYCIRPNLCLCQSGFYGLRCEY